MKKIYVKPEACYVKLYEPILQMMDVDSHTSGGEIRAPRKPENDPYDFGDKVGGEWGNIWEEQEAEQK